MVVFAARSGLQEVPARFLKTLAGLLVGERL